MTAGFTVGEEMRTLVAILDTMRAPSDNEARKNAEKQYGIAKEKNPDFVVQALLHIVANGANFNEDQRQQASIFMRRLFIPDAMLEDEQNIVFSRCSQAVKETVATTLLNCLQTETLERVRKATGNALVTLAEQHIVPSDADGKRNEAAWPQLLTTVCSMCGSDDDVSKKVNAMEMLCELLPIYQETIKGIQRDMQLLLEQSFGHGDAKVRKSAVLLVLAMVLNYKAKDWKPLQPCLAVIVKVLENLAQLQANEHLTECLEQMTETCEYEAIFFKPQVKLLANLLVQIVGAKEQLDATPRSAALEFFITLAEQKPKMCMQQCPEFGSYLIKAAMDCMMEIEDSDGQDWANIMDDEEDDDDDELFKLGGEVIDRAIQALTIKKIGSSYFQAIGMYVQNTSDWRSPMSALSAVSEGVEYVEKAEHLDQLMELCLQHTTHAHMRVRAQSWHALSRIFADHREVTERWHPQYMAATLRGLEDPVLRVQTKNLGAFLYFGEALEPVVMENYAKDLLEKLVEKINKCNHRGVIEECITSIAVVAGSIEKEFRPYYDHIMPMLKNFIKNSSEEKETRLRGKAFECMSLFGVAVGKEKFTVDVTECMTSMLQQGSASTQLEKKNAVILTDYLKDAIERVAGVMEENMEPFLPALLFGGAHGSGYMQILDLAHAARQTEAGTITGDDDDEDELITLKNGAKVKTAYFREMADAAETVACLVSNSKKAFIPHVPKVCDGLMALFKIEDKSLRASLEADEVLNKCSEVWAAITGVLAKCDQLQTSQCVAKFIELNYPFLEQATDDADEVTMLAKGTAEVLCSVCPSSSMTAEKKAEYGDVTKYLQPAQMTQLYNLCETKLQECFKRREENLLKESEWRDGAEEDDVEGEKNTLDEMDDNHEAAVAVSQIIGALMQLNPDFYTQNLLGRTDAVIKTLLDPSKIASSVQAKDRQVIVNKNKILAYYIACDICEHLRERGTSMWPSFLEKLFADLQNVDYEVRHAASYFVYLAATVPGFEQYSENALTKMVHVLQSPTDFGKGAQSKYASCDDIKVAEDNLIAAVFALLANSVTLSSKNQNLWDSLLLPKLPLKNDTEVGASVIVKLLECFQAQRADILGEGQKRIPAICAVFAEAYKSSDSEDMDSQVKKVFSSFPTDFFQTTLKPNFKDTQWKKLEKLMKDPVVGA
ncbi:unnamed protein product [Amoebophrya sp. A25]|nr:unnamed protein product [Amoebophrya sp. A25]|eukprot:GSA25T00024622001.1